jgi:hypothetical protein
LSGIVISDAFNYLFWASKIRVVLWSKNEKEEREKKLVLACDTISDVGEVGGSCTIMSVLNSRLSLEPGAGLYPFKGGAAAGADADADTDASGHVRSNCSQCLGKRQ